MDNNKNTYIVVEPRWMTGELGLTGNRLLVYALVHGFSREGAGEFTGSCQWAADLLGLRRMTVSDILRDLTNEGLLTKIEAVRDGVRYCIYRTRQGGARKTCRGCTENEHTPCTETVHNNAISSTHISTHDIANKDILPRDARAEGGSFDFAQALRDAGCDEVAIGDFLAARKARRLLNTRSAFEGLVTEAEAVGKTLPEVVRLCAANSWGGFRRSYLEEKRQGPTPTPPHKESVYEHNLRTRQQLDAYYAQRIAEEKAAREGGDK